MSYEDMIGNYQDIMAATCAEDLFGDFSDSDNHAKTRKVAELYNAIAASVQPDNFADDLDNQEIAREALTRLSRLYEAARTKISSGVYGRRLVDRPGSAIIKTEKRLYYMGPTLATGDVSTIYAGDCAGGDGDAGKVIIKIADDPSDNDLLDTEAQVLELFMTNPAVQHKHLPVLLDKAKTSDGRRMNILRRLDNVYSFTQIREHRRYQAGVYPKDLVWMMKRVLSCLGYAHINGIIHGNIEPNHLLVRPKDHNVFVVDWGYASVNQSPFKVYNPDFSAPEVQEKKTPLPSADIFSLGLCIIYLLGGDIKTKTIPEVIQGHRLEDEIRHYIEAMVLPSPYQRLGDAWQMHNEFEAIVFGLWGQKFRPFIMD